MTEPSIFDKARAKSAERWRILGQREMWYARRLEAEIGQLEAVEAEAVDDAHRRELARVIRELRDRVAECYPNALDCYCRAGSARSGRGIGRALASKPERAPWWRRIFGGAVVVILSAVALHGCAPPPAASAGPRCIMRAGNTWGSERYGCDAIRRVSEREWACLDERGGERVVVVVPTTGYLVGTCAPDGGTNG